MAKSVIGSYDIQFVTDYLQEEPFSGEAWYFGETKIYNYKVVVCLTVHEDDHTVEFLAAASLPTTVTGLLAEVGQLFLMKMDEKFTQGYNLNRVVKRLIKDDSLTATSRSVCQSEMDSAETVNLVSGRALQKETSDEGS
jgi:hypothetical protein